MEICGQYFSRETLNRIEAELVAEPEISRRQLSRRVCEWLDWRGASGRYQDMSCRKALVRLDRRGLICLPERTQGYAFEQRRDRTEQALPELMEVDGPLKALGEVEIVLVSSRYSRLSQVWNALMETYHYLGSGPLCGGQLRYLVRSGRYGWLGGLSFSGATWRLRARDEWIGWSEGAQRAHLQEIVCNSRFLILPTVKVPNLASCVLSRSLRQLPEDWARRYGQAPVLVETFVDPQRFSGTSYQAANWIYVGKTAARSDPHPNGKVSEGSKKIYVYPLRRDFRKVLCQAPERRLRVGVAPVTPADWVEEEFGRVDFYNGRLRERLYQLARDFYAQPGVLIPQACNGSEAKMKGAYRFFQNERVDMQTVLEAHRETTVERIKPQRVVLAVQDTTSLNLTAHPPEEVGPINTTQNEAVGLLLHSTLVFTVEGTPLGLLQVQCWARDAAKRKKNHKRKELPIEVKESMKWLSSYRAVAEAQAVCTETMIVSVGDREADVYELFSEAVQTVGGPKLLVRAEKSRQRQVEQETLWACMASEPVAGYQVVSLPRRGSRAARTARLTIRFARLTLQPPKDKPLKPVAVWAVYAKEVDCGPGVKEPIEWMLLTTVETTTFEQACERLAWYTRRWGIEVYHRILKSGCRIEDRRLDTADRLQTCLAIDLVVAWRIYWLTQQGRETPNLPCAAFLSQAEWTVLYAYVKKAPPPELPPSLREAVRMIAKLGGFLGRKGDGEPGTTTMWRGLQYLAALVEGYLLAQGLPPARAGP